MKIAGNLNWFIFGGTAIALRRKLDPRKARISIVLLVTASFTTTAHTESIDRMFETLSPAYTTMQGAKACELERQIGKGLWRYAEQRVTALETKSRLSPQQLDSLRKSAEVDGQSIVAIGACGSVYAAFRILDEIRKIKGEPLSSVIYLETVPEKRAPLPLSNNVRQIVQPPLPVDAPLRIKAGEYTLSKSECDDLRKGELELIAFDVDENLRSYSTGENSCTVATVTPISDSRFKVDADCVEIDVVSKSSFILDRLASGNIRIDGSEYLYCPTSKEVRTSKAMVPNLIDRWNTLNEDCRGGFGDDPETMKSCEKRAGVSSELRALDYCYEGESTATSEWKRC